MCTYSLLPSDTKGPNAKIKILQRRLLRAQQVINDLQKQVPGHGTLDDDIDPDMASEPMSTTADSIDPVPDTESSKHDTSDPTLVHSLLRSVSDSYNIAALLTSATAHFMLPASLALQAPTAQTFCQLTPYPTMLEIVYAAYSNVFALCTVVPEQDFRMRTQRLYDINPIAYQPDDTLFMPLFFSVLALGMVHSSNLHPNLDYHQILRERCVTADPRKLLADY